MIVITMVKLCISLVEVVVVAILEIISQNITSVFLPQFNQLLIDIHAIEDWHVATAQVLVGQDQVPEFYFWEPLYDS